MSYDVFIESQKNDLFYEFINYTKEKKPILLIRLVKIIVSGLLFVNLTRFAYSDIRQTLTQFSRMSIPRMDIRINDPDDIFFF